MHNRTQELEAHRLASLTHSTDIETESVREISGALTALLADVFALYLKTKNFHWHMSGPHFRDYHRLLDEQGDQLFAMTDDIAERVRKSAAERCVRSVTLRESKRIADNDADYVTPKDMLNELYEDSRALVLSMRSAHNLCENARDVATTSVLETWIDDAQKRVWFLYEAGRD